MDNFIYWGSAILVRIIMPSIILNLYFNALLIPKESKHLQKYFAWFLYMGWQYLSKRWIAYTYTKSEPSCIIESGWLGYTVIVILFRLTAVFRESWRPWKQVFTKTLVSVIHMLWDFCQEIFKVFIWFQVICFGCFSYVVYDGA